MSRNNRHLGQSGVSFPSLAQCRDSAQELCREAKRIDALTTVNNVNWRWIWKCNLDGAAVALSARSYLRQFECEYSLQRFLEALPIAEFSAAVRTVRDRRYGNRG
jgi:hypothetical protein